MPTPTHEFAERNETRPCSVTGCGRTRTWTLRWCRLHQRAVIRYGSPFGSAVRSKELARFERAASEFLRDHADHPAVIAATDWVRALLHRSAFDSDLTASEVKRVRDHDAQPGTILVRIVATWLMATWSASSSIADDREGLTYQLAAAFLRSAPRTPYPRRTPKGATRYHEAGATARRELGTRIRTGLGLFVLNVTKALGASDERAHEMRDAMAAPFPSGNSSLGPTPTRSVSSPTPPNQSVTRSGAIRTDH